MKNRDIRLVIVLLVLILIGTVTDIIITINTKSPTSARPSLPCSAIPTHYVAEYPECANNLLRAMNVTNVRILSPGSLSDLVDNRSRGLLEEAQKRYNLT